MRRARLPLVLLALSVGPVASAQESGGCTSFKWSVAREQSAFAAPDLPALASGGTFPGLSGAANVSLKPQGEVAYTVKPRRTPKASPPYGAELALEGTGGTIEVTLSGEAWVDVVQAGKVLRSAGFSGRTGCPGIRKSVRFTLAPGPAVVAISDAAGPDLKVAIMPAD